MAALRFLPNIDALVARLDGDAPGGSRAVFGRLTNEVKKLDQEDDDPDLYWAKVIRLCEPALETEAKDLRIARWVVNALPRREVIADRGRGGKPSGFEALADALTLLRRLTDEGWEYVHPQPDPDEPDPEYRNAPFEWLGVAGEGACLPDFVRRMPLAVAPAGTLSEFDWREEKKEEAREALNKVANEASVPHLRAVLADLDRGRAELARLEDVLKDRLKVLRDGADPADPNGYDYHHPGMGGLRDALAGCQVVAADLLKKLTGDTLPAPLSPEPLKDRDTPPPPARPAAGRDEAYAQVRQAADLIARLEPHSPVPYLLRWALSLEKLAFPDMLRAIDTAGEAAPALFRRLNIPDPA